MIRKSTFIKIIIGMALVSPLFIAHYHGFGNYMNVAALKENKALLHQFVSSHYFKSVCCYIVVYIMAGACSFPFVSLITITGGALFGTALGAVYTNIGATFGAVVAFIAYRYLFGDWIRRRYGYRLITFNQEIEKNGAWYLVMMRLIALIPFFVANILASLSPISLNTFIWTTSLGVIPSSLVYSFAGQQLDSINSVSDVFSGKTAIAFGLLAILIVVPVLLHHVRAQKVKSF